MRLTVIIHPGEDGFYIADCPALPGCLSQGKTEKEALKNIKEAIALWLEVEADKHAHEIPKDAVLRTVAM